MIFGIRYESTFKSTNRSLQSLGSEIMMKGKKNVYFNSLSLAFIVSQNLNRRNSNFKHSVYKLPECQEKLVNPQRIVKNIREFEDLVEQDKKELKSLTNKYEKEQ